MRGVAFDGAKVRQQFFLLLTIRTLGIKKNIEP